MKSEAAHTRGPQAAADVGGLVAGGAARCFFAGCCYGKPTPLPWGVRFTDPASLAPLGVQLHPVQIYESIGDLLIAGLLWSLLMRRKDTQGAIFWLYVFLYGTLRFFMESLRGDDRGPLYGGLAPSQVIALAAVLISGSFFLVQAAAKNDAHT